MTKRLKNYYDLNNLYADLAEKGNADIVRLSEELTRKHNEILAKMSEEEILYLQNKSFGMSKMRFEPYLKKLREQKAAKAKATKQPAAPRANDEYAATANT